MAYIGTQDLIGELGEDKLVQLTDDERTGDVNETRVLKAIEYAQGVFDSYARSRYKLPVTVTPLVKALNLDLAIFHLYKSRATVSKEGIYEIRKGHHDEAIKRLLDISKGNSALDIPAVEETVDNPGTPDRILTNANKQVFTDNKLSGF